MDTSIWMIISWLGVAVLTGINIFGFVKLAKASRQMMNMAFPGANSVDDVVKQMQGMMKSGKRGRKGMGAAAFSGQTNQRNAQLQKAMGMLQQANKKR